jgi:DNA gyrase subunit A
MFVASSHDYILFFTNLGRVYKIKGYEVPESSRTAKGTSAVNLIPLMSGERVSSMIKVSDFNGEDYLIIKAEEILAVIG